MFAVEGDEAICTPVFVFDRCNSGLCLSLNFLAACS